MKVFLGGTCNGSKWRDRFIDILEIDYFNPVGKDWTIDCIMMEWLSADYCLYVITPKMTGAYSIAEVIDDSNKRPDKTIFCYLSEDGELQFTNSQKNSLDKVGSMVVRNGGRYFYSLATIALFLNKRR